MIPAAPFRLRLRRRRGEEQGVLGLLVQAEDLADVAGAAEAGTLLKHLPSLVNIQRKPCPVR